MKKSMFIFITVFVLLVGGIQQMYFQVESLGDTPSKTGVNTTLEEQKPEEEFDALRAKMYRLLAKQIVEDYKVMEGLCLDIGCGSGELDVELLKATKLHIIGLDIDPDAIVAARKTITKAGVDKRMSLVLGDVHDMPFKDDLFPLIISRGSYLFWQNKVKAMKEIYRVLKPGGIAFVGGGFGKYLSQAERDKIRQFIDEARRKNPAKEPKREKFNTEDLQRVAQKAQIEQFELIKDFCSPGCGGWIVIRKSR